MTASRIQTSIHGKHVGLNYDKALQTGEGFVAGERGVFLIEPLILGKDLKNTTEL